ncbi:4-hydroxy-tetrahydrodipicolinate synthase [Breznakiella homolactica]|uniref:4-hydroxy-tetrahydrodipicolinate synthase n=1 Tax=Breznakiella homolactica TaxID=2798577 RepID=A0A7T7XLN1_9SPIR|nr:4-hydroxy-tetrahydrodipicolinate synthase [Breznakiella homolactica]QQO08670.1 4-hydroxy-tetrahydrodipicolinate synthase [Breznakiella homolactica]
MEKKAIKGIVTPIITPMNPDETINEGELRRQVQRQLDNGIHGIFCFGTNGEGYILTAEEKQRVLEAVMEETAGKVPVYAGTGCVGTGETIRQSQMAERAGADVLSIITPSFAAASQDELYTHYAAVAKETSLPILLYNIPARTGNSLAPDTVKRLAENVDNIVGIKDSSGNFDNILQYIEGTRHVEGFCVLSGNDSLILWTLLAGGSGAIAGCANVYPRTMASIYDKFTPGDISEAREFQDSIRSLRNCFRFGNPNTITKKAVALLGYGVGECRAPFNQISEAGIQALKQVLADNKAKGMC